MCLGRRGLRWNTGWIQTQAKTTKNIIFHPFLTNSIIFRFCLVINLISRSFHNLQAHQKTLENNGQHIIYLRYLAVKHINKWKFKQKLFYIRWCLMKKGSPWIGRWRYVSANAGKKEHSTFRRNGHIFIISSHIHTHSNNFPPSNVTLRFFLCHPKLIFYSNNWEGRTQSKSVFFAGIL